MVTHESLVDDLARAGLDFWTEEDADLLVCVLMERYSALEVQSWLFLYDSELDGTPLVLLEQGRGREVMRRARQIVGRVGL